MRILLSDISHRKTFDVYNCVRRLGHQTILADRKPNVLNSIIYGQRIHSLRLDSADMFSTDLNHVIRLYGDEDIVFLPCEEDTTLRFLEYVNENDASNLRYLLPKRHAFELARDKGRLNRFCRDNDLPCPRELTIDELRAAFMKAIAKPVIGSGSDGVVYLNKKEDLAKLKSDDSYLVQEQLPASMNVLGGFFLFKDGKCISYYGHKRIRTYPEVGGVTVYSRIDCCSEIETVGMELLSRLNWNGLAMVEFLYDPDEGRFKVIEVNPRLWGSFLLSEYGNTGFLDNYIRAATGKQTKWYKPKKDAFIRWFFPFDLIYYIKRRGQVKGFWNFDRARTCYIGFTYASWWKSLAFLLFGMLNVGNLQRFVKKLF